MNKYDKSKIIPLLDAETISALLRIYGIGYKNLAVRFGVTREAVWYRQKVDCWKPYEREMLLDLFVSYGMELAELILLHQMINKRKVD
ncbi:hypothetical protein [Cytobacillus oceanisediminis]|uniref:hypothetical protein n=1 Tax=Cytobacillus oceanisediminis TaxID=665099 RepID=UPI00207A3B1F|nr:hypothetical protein [Cytobacillus oceanisediminis]USK45517.1 hypothetical protein LIT27_06620 [Cytobacillus oceanisediminis]